jgi:[acyl-carrier-protein] S-malonyltransferase
MSRRHVVHVFPGQGDFSLIALTRAVHESAPVKDSFLQVFPRIDAAGANYGIPALTERLLAPSPPTEHDLDALAPGAQQLAMYGAQMTVHQALTSIGLPADRILGVSFGEIAALAAAGVYSLEDGARAAIRAARSLLHYPGGMTLLLASPHQAEDLIRLSGARDAVIACVNHCSETVVTSPDCRELDCLEQCAADNQVRALRLPLPFRSHHPSLAFEANDLSGLLHSTTTEAPSIPLYSAVHSRAYTLDDDLISRAIDSLVLPFHLPEALSAASPEGPTLWLESSPGKAFTRSARRTLRAPHEPISPLVDPNFHWEAA